LVSDLAGLNLFFYGVRSDGSGDDPGFRLFYLPGRIAACYRCVICGYFLRIRLISYVICGRKNSGFLMY